MRQSGLIPAVLYGHGEGTEMLTIQERELNKVIDHGAHVVKLAGDASDSALIKDVQWDAFGSRVLHVDLTRVNPNEPVEVTLPIELVGDAVGTHHGGVVNFHQHELTVMCPANAVPEKIELRINDLDVDQAISAGEVPLPAGATIAEAGTTPIISCALPVVEQEEVEGSEGEEPAAE